jgi:DNA-binding transcriptional LysR family regulator
MPRKVVEVRELQIAVGLVAAGEGVAVVPESVHGMKRNDVRYRPLADRQAVSPVMFSTRNLDKSEELRNMLAVIYEIYDEVGIPHVKETL